MPLGDFWRVETGGDGKVQHLSAIWPRIWAGGELLYPVILTLCIVNLSGTENPATPGGIPYFDKLAHFCVFGLLATVIFRIIPPPSRHFQSALAVIGLVSIFGLSDEIHQSFTPDRTVEFADWVADTLGALVAVVAYWEWEAYYRLMEFSRR